MYNVHSSVLKKKLAMASYITSIDLPDINSSQKLFIRKTQPINYRMSKITMVSSPFHEHVSSYTEWYIATADTKKP